MDRRRSLAFAALTATMAAALALPTAAAAKTRWVDDDGKAGPTGCSGVAVATKAIQSAITKSGAGDVIKVCPGTYTGRLTIQGARDGLKLLAATTTKPVIQVAPTAAVTILRISGTDDVTVRGLTMRSDSGDPCNFRGGIDVTAAKRAILSRLRIESVGTATNSGCQLGTGITVGDSSATISNVRIVDPTSNGIAAFGATTVTVKNATVDYLHAAGAVGTAGVMVKAESGAKGSFTSVTVNGLATGGVSTPRLAVAVELRGAGAGFVVQDVTTSYALTGLKVGTSQNAAIAGVDVTGSTTGVWLDTGTGADVSGVSLTDTQFGITVSSATGATIHDNDVTGATIAGCSDATTGGAGTLGTKNTWTTNTTSTPSSPVGLCGDAA